MMISAIIPSRDRCKELNSLLAALRLKVGDALEVIVVDDGSRDGTAELVRRDHPWVRLLCNPSALGAARAKNQGAAAADGELLWFLDSDSSLVGDDTILKSGPAMLANQDRAGAVGGEIFLRYDARSMFRQKVLAANGETHTISYNGSYGGTLEVAYLPTCNLMMRKDLFFQVGGFDPGYFYLMEDADLCHRIQRLGYSCLASDETAIVHDLVLEGREGDLFLGHRNRIRYMLLNAPAYKASLLPLLDLWLIASPYKVKALLWGHISADKHLSPTARALGRRRWTVPLKVALAGADYLASLARGYAWNMLRLPGTLSLRWRGKRDFLCQER